MLALRIGLIVALVLLLAVEPSESWGRFRFRIGRIIRIFTRKITPKPLCYRSPCPDNFQNDGQCESINKAIIKREEWNALASRDQPKPLARLPHVVSLWHTGAATCDLIGLSRSNCQQCIQDGTCVKELILALQNEDIGNGKDDIRYNFLIGQDGVIYEGRGWGVAGEFIDEFSMHTFSVAMIGNFDKLEPSQASQNALDDLIQCGQSSGYLATDPDLVTSPEMSGKALDEMIRRLEKGDK